MLERDAGLQADAARAWDREYAAGRYRNEPPVPFIDDILLAAQSAVPKSGLYIGCGNGRNYLPLVQRGLHLIGLDISPIAIAQLAQRAPELVDQLVCGDVHSLAPDARFNLVIGIQVFQHGRREVAHAHVRAAQERVLPGGIIAVRVNAVGTDINLRHQVLETAPDGSFTVQYEEGPKCGLPVHFFSHHGLSDMFAESFDPVLPLRLQTMARQPPEPGHWAQWEGIWTRR